MSRLVPPSPIAFRAIILDSGPLGLAANPKSSPENDACNRWIEQHLENGVRVCVPEIADYEVRRELLRAGLHDSVTALDAFINTLDYLPLNTNVMRQAALFWAQARNAGRTTADRHAVDGDVILAAQALEAGNGERFVVATTNEGHIGRFVPAKAWRFIL